MPDLAALTLDEQMTYWTGQVARNDVRIESQLRRIVRELAGRPLGSRDEVRQFSRLYESAKVALADTPMPDDVRSDLKGALVSANLAHAQRIRLVHDIWLQDGHSPNFFVSDYLMGRWDFPLPVPTTPLGDFSDIACEQVMVVHRLSGFEGVLHALRRIEAAERSGTDPRGFFRARLAYERAIAQGAFIPEGGGVRLHDETIVDDMWRATEAGT